MASVLWRLNASGNRAHALRAAQQPSHGRQHKPARNDRGERAMQDAHRVSSIHRQRGEGTHLFDAAGRSKVSARSDLTLDRRTSYPTRA
jgi:hypothetical protein